MERQNQNIEKNRPQGEPDIMFHIRPQPGFPAAHRIRIVDTLHPLDGLFLEHARDEHNKCGQHEPAPNADNNAHDPVDKRVEPTRLEIHKMGRKPGDAPDRHKHNRHRQPGRDKRQAQKIGFP